MCWNHQIRRLETFYQSFDEWVAPFSYLWNSPSPKKTSSVKGQPWHLANSFLGNQEFSNRFFFLPSSSTLNPKFVGRTKSRWRLGCFDRYVTFASNMTCSFWPYPWFSDSAWSFHLFGIEMSLWLTSRHSLSFPCFISPLLLPTQPRCTQKIVLDSTNVRRRIPKRWESPRSSQSAFFQVGETNFSRNHHLPSS